MSHKEVKRAQVLELQKEDRISQQEAARRLDVSTRQVRRLTKRYQAAGLTGLIRKKRGSASNSVWIMLSARRPLNSSVRITATLARRWPA